MKIICAYCILYLQFHHQRMLFWSDPDTWCLWHHSHWGDPWERGGVSLNVPVCHRISPARGRLSFSTVPWAAVVRFMGRYALWGRDGTAMTHTACLCPPSSKHWPTLTPSSHSKTNNTWNSLNTDFKSSYPLWPPNLTTTLWCSPVKYSQLDSFTHGREL